MIFTSLLVIKLVQLIFGPRNTPHLVQQVITWTGPRSNGPSELVQGIHSPFSFFLSLDSATPPREDYVQVDYALQSRYKV